MPAGQAKKAMLVRAACACLPPALSAYFSASVRVVLFSEHSIMRMSCERRGAV